MLTQSKEIKEYLDLICVAGMTASIDKICDMMNDNHSVLQYGMLAIMDEFIKGKLSIDQAFVLLDYSKSVAFRTLLFFRNMERSGHDIQLLMRPRTVNTVLDSINIQNFLKSRGHDTAIVSLFEIDKEHIAVFVARYPGPRKIVPGIRHSNGIYYGLTYLDGAKPELCKSLESYIKSIKMNMIDSQLLKHSMEFWGSAIFVNLVEPDDITKTPQEVIFIPHKLTNILPLHALSVDLGYERLYFHDVIERMSYSSSLEEIVNGGRLMFYGRRKSQLRRNKKRFLVVRDAEADLECMPIEQQHERIFRMQLESQGLLFDTVLNLSSIPNDLSSYIWVNWSSHAQSDATDWGQSYLSLGLSKISASTIVKSWNFNQSPTIILAACETAVDISNLSISDEYCGLDVAFRIAGARAVIATLWDVQDLVAAITAWMIPSWVLAGRSITPDIALTTIQRHFRRGDWKRFLLDNKTLRKINRTLRNEIGELQSELWKMPDEAFSSETSWAVFRCFGR